MKKLQIPPVDPGKKDIAALQTALTKLNLTIAPDEASKAELGKTTRAAIRKIQKSAGLNTDGKLTPETMQALNIELEHVYYAANKTRTDKIHGLLERLGHPVNAGEVKHRAFGKSTEEAIKEFQEKAGLPPDGRLSDVVVGRLEEEALRVRLSTKTQVGQLQRTLLRAGRIAKLGMQIDANELKQKELGQTTHDFVRAFQKKYGLPETGEVNPVTYERMVSVAASRPIPVKMLKVKTAEQLTPIKKSLRLNMANQQVGGLQQTLAYLGYQIDAKEFNTKTFGKTTRAAVIEYQRKNKLPVTGHADGETLVKLNSAIETANPQAATIEFAFRVRGAVRDERWKGQTGFKVQVWEKQLRGLGVLLAERKTLSNGFFDIPYDPPRNPTDGQIKSPFHLTIKVLDQNNQEQDSKVLFNPTQIAWTNFTGGTEPYRGTSEFETRMKMVSKPLSGVAISEIEESLQQQEITYVALNSGLSPEDVMRLALAHRAANQLNNPAIGPEVFYAFIRQNLPPNLPGDLLNSTADWTLIDALVDQTVNGMVFMDGELQTQAFENAIQENLIPITIGLQKAAILAALAAEKQTFALEKPILVGNGNLKSLLEASNVDQTHYTQLASTFLQHRGFSPEFWDDINTNAGNYGGAAIIQDLETTINLGHITKNHVETLSFLKGKIESPAVAGINSPRDLAKLTHNDWVNLIEENNGVVPPGTDGNTAQEQINTYASILAVKSEQLFPSVSFAAHVSRSANTNLAHTAEIQQLLDQQPELDLTTANIDLFVKENNIAVSNEALAEARVMQRVRRLAPNAAAGTILLEAKIHHSAQIVAQGKENFVALMEKNGIDERSALTMYAHAEFKYAQVLNRLADYRFELYQGNPAAIIPYTYTADEMDELLSGIPNLEVLFGSLDYCDCKHCESVYGPAAYLADLLRFLEEKDSEQANKKVGDFLKDRRPDIGNIKLNCENTETPLPYIDLVCEVLENAIPAPNPNQNFSFQTTLSAEELRAFPENVRKAAYDLLKTTKFPMDISLNLWQEESRIFLEHLGVNRYELMEAFQSRPTGGPFIPTDSSIAAEYWGISSQETNLVVTSANTTAQQDEFWGFDTTRKKLVVSEFLDHAHIEYADLLDLLYVQWINPIGAANNIILNRAPESCSIDEQELANLNTSKFDQIHRFLRLWRRTGRKMWELDLLLRSSKVGNSTLDSDAIVRLKEFKQVQEKLGLAFDQALCFFHQINTEVRDRPEAPQKKIQPLYMKLFQNPAITDPVNPRFGLPLSGADNLIDQKATLLAAFALTEQDLLLLIEKTDGKLNLNNLTRIHNWITLARSLKLSAKDLLILLELTNIPVPFTSTKQALDFLEIYDWVKVSGFEVQELDYLLNDRPDSPHGLRDELITQYITTLREALRTNPASHKKGQAISQIANTFNLTDEQAQLLLENLNLNGVLATHFEDANLTAKDNNDQYITPISLNNFPNLFASYRLLHKAATLVKRHSITPKADLEWLLQNSATFNLLNPNALPVNGNPAQPLFPNWVALHMWLHFKAQFPEPEDSSLRKVFDLAGNPASTSVQLHEAINKLTNWSVTDLDDLHVGLQFKIGGASDYKSIETYFRLWKCFKQSKRTGVAASVMLAWANRDHDVNDAQLITAQQVRQAAKSKYDTQVWLTRSTPLQDLLRERKRAALTRYLIERSLRVEPAQITFNGKQYANTRRWKDNHELLSYFLIDVEMSSCMLTSRLKQAISSVQMFVQRCFLSLEQPYIQVSQEEREDRVSENSWRQWKWMKNYRIWEANRKVFLYPENWILPELRDDKSPFFKEFENELQGNEITHENAEVAFLHYLQKVHEVSRLEIVGVYHELDDDNPSDDTPPNINILHVVGRTRSDPAIYYYRQFDLNYDTWTTWEKIDVDVSSEHVVPVIYNRKLHLFWLIFVEKPQKVRKQPPAKASDNPTNTPEPPRLLEIQLAWCVRTGEGWSSKKISRYKIVHPWERPLFTYNFKPRYKSRDNQLWLDIYVSTSVEFNNARFYDPYKNEYTHLTAMRFDELGRPWHSSSFVFDGEVVEIKLKALRGFYHLLNAQGVVADGLTDTDSFRYVQDQFGATGRTVKELQGGYEIAPRLALPDGMHFHYTHLANNKQTLNANQLNVLEGSATRQLLAGAQNPFELVFSQHQIQFDVAADSQAPLFYQDQSRSYFIRPEWQTFILGYNTTLQRLKYTFYPFYHPYTALFIRELNRSGLDGLLNRRIQLFPHTYYPGNNFNFTTTYNPPSPHVADASAERDRVDFSRFGAYAIYNWEIFFHAPFLIASRLSQNQRFEEAMRWFHYIFDPTSVEALDVPQRYWITKPFYEQNSEDYRKQRIEELLKNINQNDKQVNAWKNDPFKPHLIARYRPVAYQKAIVMKYIDNLIAWGDQLFRRDTIESINEATMLYVLAYELMGKRPVRVPQVGRPEYSYNELTTEEALDIFGNRRVDVLLENFTNKPVQIVRTQAGAEPLPNLDVFYFCIPNNDKLLSYWDTIEDRLFKIRHCMNIEGVVRQLPLFEPPIDPALLVKAAAAGIDLSSILIDTTAAQGQYRFRLLVQKALEFTASVTSLGDKLLTVLEKKDAEGLALLRSVNEIALLEAIKDVRKQQIDEANETWSGLEKALEMATAREEYYRNKEFMNTLEIVAAALSGGSILVSGILTVNEILASIFHLLPSFNIGISGFGGSPEVTVQWGSSNIASSMQASNSSLQHIGSILSQSSSLVGSMAGYQRRMEEWSFQGDLAEIEIDQIERQIAAAKIRHAIAEKELENQELQIEHSESVDEYMHNKYTNQQLYDWMLSQLATVYFQSYQLAFDVAKRAEKSFQFELGKPTETFIQFGYWDSLKKGLVAGEKLTNDLRRMETEYLDQNKRELELTKHVSLAQYFPLQLVQLKETGSCSVTLPEWLFDMDYLGHYRRRIKSVSITIPCVVGPYTNVNCTLSLTNQSIRLTDDVAGGYGDPLGPADPRFYRSPVPVQSIATSNAQNDAGVFELNFNDERYLPFEGAGAVSQWNISLPMGSNQFDFTTISDIILHIRYTATAGNLNLINAAKTNLDATLPTAGFRLFILNREFGTEWQRFFNPAANTDQTFVFALKTEHLPFYARNKNVRLSKVDIFVDSNYANTFDLSLQLPGGGAATNETMSKDPNFNNIHHLEKANIIPASPALGEWQIKIKKDSDANFRLLTRDDIQHAYLVFAFSIQ